MALSRKSNLLAAALIALVVSALALTDAEHASAQENPEAEAVVFNGPAGPYHVKVIQSPARAVVGTVRLVVEPTELATGEPVENALVRVFGTPDHEGERQYTPALNLPSDRTVYYGQLELEEAGMWTIDVEVESDLGVSLAITQIEIHDRARGGDNTFIGTVLFILVIVAFVGAGVWLWYTSKKARERRNAIRRSGGRPTLSKG